MKKIIKTMAVLATFGLMFSFASCASDDDSDTPVIITTKKTSSPVNGVFTASIPNTYTRNESNCRGTITIVDGALTGFRFQYMYNSTTMYFVSSNTSITLDSVNSTKVEVSDVPVEIVKETDNSSASGTVKFTIAPTEDGNYIISNYSLKLNK